MKRHADMPAARIATNSWLRASLAKANTPPQSTAKGSIFCPRSGNCRTAIPITTMVATP